jgi:hypothetical protein
MLLSKEFRQRGVTMQWDRKPGQALAAVALTLLTAACSGGSSADAAPDVASLAGAGGTPAASASAKAASRPRERLDTTPEEYEQMLKPLDKCLREHGAKPKSEWTGRPAKADMDKLEAAGKICEPLYLPLPPWEKDPANPEAKDFARDVVKCLKGKGVKYVEVSEDGVSISLGGPNNHAQSISKGMDLMPECERTVAAAGK